MSPKPPQPGLFPWNAGRAQLRLGPALEASVLAEVRQGTKIDVLHSTTEWLYVAATLASNKVLNGYVLRQTRTPEPGSRSSAKDRRTVTTPFVAVPEKGGAFEIVEALAAFKDYSGKSSKTRGVSKQVDFQLQPGDQLWISSVVHQIIYERQAYQVVKGRLLHRKDKGVETKEKLTSPNRYKDERYFWIVYTGRKHVRMLSDTTSSMRQDLARLKAKSDKAGAALAKLGEVQWSGIIDTKGLEADWHFLWLVWLLELAPESLGRWSSDKSTVEITRGDYVSDLRSRPHHKKALQEFKARFPTLERAAPGQKLTTSFQFVGPETARPGQYNAVEWFLGSYKTTLTVTGQDRAARRAHVQVTVTNTSHWQSATRAPAIFKKALHFPDYLVSDATRGKSVLGGGDFHQRFVWHEQVSYDTSTGQSTSTTEAAATYATGDLKGFTSAELREAFPIDMSKGKARLTSSFGSKDVPRAQGAHKGIDLGCPVGTPLHFLGNGKLTRAWREDTSLPKNRRGYGNSLYIQFPDGHAEIFAHLNPSAIDELIGPRFRGGTVSPPVAVKAGQSVPGGTGNSGHTTGPHLHWEVHTGPKPEPINPLWWLKHGKGNAHP